MSAVTRSAAIEANYAAMIAQSTEALARSRRILKETEPLIGKTALSGSLCAANNRPARSDRPNQCRRPHL